MHYLVLRRIDYDRSYAAGESIDLKEHEAAPLLAAGAIVEQDDAPDAQSQGGDAKAAVEAAERRAADAEARAERAEERETEANARAAEALARAEAAEARLAAAAPNPNSDPEAKGQSGAAPADSRRGKLTTALTDIKAAGGDKPTVKALKAASGVRDVKAAERDDIWASIGAGD